MDGARLAAMARRNLNDLLAFVTVAREGSFTRAAAALGVTQSALSQTVRALEERLQIRLLTRTTRSVSPTAAGERLMQAIGHRFDEIEADRKSTRLNSSHLVISYAVFCLKKKKKPKHFTPSHEPLTMPRTSPLHIIPQ